MSNSSLVNYTRLSPNCNKPRTHAIDKITIHHMAMINPSLETIGAGFANPARQGSSNYGIDSNGRIGLFVEEKDRAWTSGNAENDHRAVTIEVANCKGEPNWEVSDKAMDVLIKLCADICKRNGIKKLNFTGDATGNLTLHKYFQATGCPGPYLTSKMAWIANQVNEILNPTVVTNVRVGDIITIKSGATYTNGAIIPAWVLNSTLYAREVTNSTVVFSTQASGAITGSTLKANVTVKQTASTPITTDTLKVGDIIQLKTGSKYTTGAVIPNWVLNATLYCRAINGNNITFSTQATGAITGVTARSNIAQASTVTSYIVKITASTTPIRSGAGDSYSTVSTVKKNEAYTIVEEKNGYGRLKSGAGWVKLSATTKL